MNFLLNILNFIKKMFEDNTQQPIPPQPEPLPTPEPIPEQIPTPKVSKIDKWMEAITKMEAAKPYRNNPGNLRYIGQQYAVNDKGFCKFDTLQHGKDALRRLLVNACTGLSKVYNPNMNLYQFYNIYAPSSDGNDPKNYANFVAKYIGVSPNIQIKELV